MSVATSGTHDTETLAEWWDAAPGEERSAVATLGALRSAGCDPASPFCERTRDAILRTLFESGSAIVLLPIQDVFGWRDRINVPALISEVNWCWRLPWPVEDLLKEPQARERAAFLRALAEQSGRTQ
jgi:4-alpha-glucanotransferase